MSHFEIKAKDCMARLGVFKTLHGDLKTPLLMPVIHPGKSIITPAELVNDFGFQMVITNSYIIKSHDRFRERALADGVHELLGVDVPIMTDSGTFQMYFHQLPTDEIDPLEIVEFQRMIGSDIGTILDVFSDPKVGRPQVEHDMRVSLERARLSVAKKGDMYLAGTVQGGTYPDLREESARELAQLDFDVHPIGGVVPLMERYRYADIVRVVLAAKKHLPPDRPVHLFGCGHPMFFALATLLGCDLFDSASYAKFAEDGRYMLTSGTYHLQNLRELPCECPVCSRMTAEELRSTPRAKREELLMQHNLYVSIAEMRRVRNAIASNKLLELAAIRARGHPSLYEALQVFLDHYSLIEEYDPVGGTSSIFYTGVETAWHPGLRRFQHRIVERYPYRNPELLVLVPDLGGRPYFDSSPDLIRAVRRTSPHDVVLTFVTPFGVVPWELEHVHPAQQCLFPSILDSDTLNISLSRLLDFLNIMNPKRLVWLSRDGPMDVIREKLPNTVSLETFDKSSAVVGLISERILADAEWRRRKLTALFAYQWALDHIDLEGTRVAISRSTGKIRYVSREDTILFTVVPLTGLMAPTLAGGGVLLEQGLPDIYRVIMGEDAVPFVQKGKSALAKFVLEAHPQLRGGEEVVILSPSQELIGVGRAILSGHEMLAFTRGVAVATRHAT